MGEREEITGMLKKLGEEEQSTLFDQLERLSVEVQLKQAILGRSLSEPSEYRLQPEPRRPQQVNMREERRGRGLLRLDKLFNYLFKPIICKKPKRHPNPNRDSGHGKGDNTIATATATAGVSVTHNRKDPKISWKTFSRSLRL